MTLHSQLGVPGGDIDTIPHVYSMHAFVNYWLSIRTDTPFLTPVLPHCYPRLPLFPKSIFYCVDWSMINDRLYKPPITLRFVPLLTVDLYFMLPNFLGPHLPLLHLFRTGLIRVLKPAVQAIDDLLIIPLVPLVPLPLCHIHNRPQTQPTELSLYAISSVQVHTPGLTRI